MGAQTMLWASAVDVGKGTWVKDLHACLSTAESKLDLEIHESEHHVQRLHQLTNRPARVQATIIGSMSLGPPQSCGALIAERKVWMWLKLLSNHEAAGSFPQRNPLATELAPPREAFKGRACTREND